MNHPLEKRSLLLLLAVAIAAVGCQDRRSVSTSSRDENLPRETEPDPETKESGIANRIAAADKHKMVAEKAQDALSTQLSQRLMSVMQLDGPAAAIDVCSKEAVTLAEAVGKEYGVKIGRTSFKEHCSPFT
jgi:hypothetical protein